MASEREIVHRWRNELGPSPITYVRENSDLQVINTTTETALLEFTIDAGMLDGDRGFRVALDGFVLNDSGGAVDYTFRVKLGGTTMFAGEVTWNDIGTAVNHPFHMAFDLMAKDAANVQEVFGDIRNETATVTLGASGEGANNFYGAAAEDGETELVITVTVQMDTAHASASCSRRRFLIEYL